jgi:hypothetical protein
MYAQSTCAHPVPTWTTVQPSTFGWSARKVCIASKFAGHLIIVDTSAISSQMQCQTQHQTLPLACKQKQDSDRAHKSKVDLIPPLRGEYDKYGMSREQFVAKFATRRIHDSTNVLLLSRYRATLFSSTLADLCTPFTRETNTRCSFSGRLLSHYVSTSSASGQVLGHEA